MRKLCNIHAAQNLLKWGRIIPVSRELGGVQSDHVHNVPSLIIGHLLLPGELNGLHAVWEGVWRVGSVGGEGCGGVGVGGRASL